MAGRSPTLQPPRFRRHRMDSVIEPAGRGPTPLATLIEPLSRVRFRWPTLNEGWHLKGTTQERVRGLAYQVPHISYCTVPGQRANASVTSDRRRCQHQPERAQKVAKIFSIGSVLFWFLLSVLGHCDSPEPDAETICLWKTELIPTERSRANPSVGCTR